MKNTCSRIFVVLSVMLLLVSAFPMVCHQSAGANDADGHEEINDEEFTTPFTLVYSGTSGSNDKFTGGRNGDTPMQLYEIFSMAFDKDIYYLPAGNYTQATTITVNKSIKIVGSMNDDGVPTTCIKKGYFGTSSNGHLFNCAFRSSELAADRGHVVIMNLLIDNDTSNVYNKANCGIQAIGNVSVDVHNTKITNFNYFSAFSVNAANTINGAYRAVDTEMHCYGVTTENNMSTVNLFALPRHDIESGSDILSHAYFTYDNKDIYEDFKDVLNFVMESSITKRTVGYGNCLVNGYSLDEPTVGELKVKLKGGIYRTEKGDDELSSGHICIYTIADGKKAYVVTKGENVCKITYDLNGGKGDVPASQWVKGSDALADMNSAVTKDNYIFLGWSRTQGATIPEFTASNTWFKIDKDVTLYAVYELKGQKTLTINVEVGDGGTADKSTCQVEYGSSFEISFFAYDNCRIKAVYVNGENVGAVQLYKLTNITKDVTTIRVEFESSPGTVTEVDEEGNITEKTVTEKSIGVETIEKVTDKDGNVNTYTEYRYDDLDVTTTLVNNDIVISNIVPESKVGGTESDDVTVSEDQIVYAVKQAQRLSESAESSVILIDAGEATSETTKRTDVSLNLNDTTRKMIADNDVKIISATGTVTLDGDAIEGITEEDTSKLVLTIGEPKSLSPEQEKVIGENKVVSAKIEIEDSSGKRTEYTEPFEGEVTVYLNYKVTNPENYRVYFVAQSGSLEEVKEKYYDAENEIISFTVKHFSEYMIQEGATPEKTVESMNAVLIAVVCVTAVSFVAFSMVILMYTRRT